MKNAAAECILEGKKKKRSFPHGLLKIIKVFFEDHHGTA